MGQDRKRQPAGITAGGQFATQRRDEATVGLGTSDGPGDRPAPQVTSVVSPDAYDLNDRMTDLAGTYYAKISDDHLNELTHEVAEAFERAQERTLAERKAAFITTHIGIPYRPTEEVLYEPLSPFEIAMRRDEDNWVEGYIALDLGDVIDGDLEGHIDQVSEKLVGSSLLMDVNFEPVRIENGEIIGKASGDISMVVEDWEADNHDDVEDLDELDEDAKMFAIGVGARQALDPLRRRQD